MPQRYTLLGLIFISCLPCVALAQSSQTRPAKSTDELKFWLENMASFHRYSIAEMCDVTGLTEVELQQRLAEFDISQQQRPQIADDRLLVLPYPGGRHPRIDFLEGAIDPQRETKLSVFAPWDQTSYAVLDVPEAIWSDLGLTYLAHTHIDTIWTARDIELERQEWSVLPDGNFELVRRLPNGIEFGIKVQPLKDNLRMKMWLTNGTDQPLSDLRVQNCVMLKGMAGFTAPTNENKLFRDGYAVAHSADRTRWIISAWDPNHRTWGNTRCPCLHSDPKFEDCQPGQTRWLRGWFSFYQGTDIDTELQRIEGTQWRKHPLHHVTGNLVGKVVDADSNQLIPCRLYVQSEEDQQWFFARSTAVAGSAVTYDKRLGQTTSIERHTTLSADGFQLDLPSGRYRIRAEHGKEYLPAESVVEIGGERVNVELKLKRFVDMAKRGWYSGDTHVHRTLDELPNVQLAEDLNVALPLTYWVRDSAQTPSASGQLVDARPVYIDPLHVYYPMNTEYEIFSINQQRHTQGAVFILNHHSPLGITAPPVQPIAAEARRQGALLDLDKHSWNWSAMIVPIMNVDLYELTNNHHWRTQFGFPRWTLESAPPNWPEIAIADEGFTERGWTEFGFQTYYAFLNCGFRMRVTGGTASGVHPVPLGHGRVYVHTGLEFSYEEWLRQLNLGHSFVTQGPLMDVRFNDELPGSVWSRIPSDGKMTIRGTIDSAEEIESVEIIKNGEIAERLAPSSKRSDAGGFQTTVQAEIPVNGTCWVALRCFQKMGADMASDKQLFAHTNPVFVDIADSPLQPRRRDVEYFIDRMNAELARNENLLTEEQLAEYRQAKTIYEEKLKHAR